MNTEIKTKFDATNKFKNIMDMESSRYALGSTHVMQTESADDVYLTATDGRIMAVNRVSGHTDETRLVPGSVMPTKLKGGKVELNGKWMNDSGKYADEIDEGRFPAMDQVLPVLSAESHILLHLGADVLRNLCEAMVDNRDGSHNITLAIDTGDVDTDKKDNYRHVSGAVTVIGQTGRFGVIMPLTRGDSGIPQRHAEQCADYRRAFEQRGTITAEESTA